MIIFDFFNTSIPSPIPLPSILLLRCIINLMIRNIRLDKLKIKTKNYVQSFSTNIAEIKLSSKESFEKKIDNNNEFNDYISTPFVTQTASTRG